MNPLIWKILPWGAAVVGLAAALLLFGSMQRAKGEANAHRATAERLAEQYTVDSTARVAREADRADQLAKLRQELAATKASQAGAAARGDSVTRALRKSLDSTQAAQLDLVTAEHEKERTYFALREANWKAQLSLKDVEIADLNVDRADLTRINTELKDATKGSSGKGGFLTGVVVGGAAVTAIVTTVVLLAK